ncbi:MAG: hypothetical protein MUP49_00450 [Dehalococcoidia bacterium]|nr:hypothetical protein [Dehalococcoidia bacterium]
MNDSGGIIGAAIGLVFAAIIVTVVTWDIDVVEPYYTSEPFHYELKLVREKQVPDFPWFWQEVTQAQYLVKNTEDRDGMYTLNFHFDNGTNSETETMRIDIMSGEEKAVTINSPLTGVSTISLNVVPPNKFLLQQRTVKKKVNAWYYLPGLQFLFK